MLSPLRDPRFRRLFLAQVFSLLGAGVMTVALGLLAFDLAGGEAGVVLGTALTLKMVAYVGLAPLGAVLAERMPRRAFLVALDLGRAALFLLLPFVTEIWQIYVLVFLSQALSSAFTPTFQATIPDVLTDERVYTRALSLSRLAQDLESVASPLLAGLLLGAMSFGGLFAVTAGAFVLSALLVGTVALPVRRHTRGGTFVARVTRGLRIYVRTPRLQGLFAFYVALAAASAMVIVNTVVLVKEELGQGDRMLAVYLGAFGLGSMAAALAVPRLVERVEMRVAGAWGGALCAAGLAAAAVAPGVLVWAVLGIGTALPATLSGRVLTRSCRAEDRPALFAAHFAVSHLAWLVAYPTAGWLGASLGLPATALVLSCAAALATVAGLWLWPAPDPAVMTHTHDAREMDHTGAGPVTHAHEYYIDDAHRHWPRAS
ncbi:MAG: MFS transporter [Pseudomonadota bacterium]